MDLKGELRQSQEVTKINDTFQIQRLQEAMDTTARVNKTDMHKLGLSMANQSDNPMLSETFTDKPYSPKSKVKKMELEMTEEEKTQFIEKFGKNPNGKLYFTELKKDISKAKETQPGPTADEEAQLRKVEEGVDNLMLVFSYLQKLMNDYDSKLINVINRHEQDFLAAYKTHMTKVEKQLQLLKNKAKEQENKLNNDDRIIRMEKNLVWYKEEFDKLIELKESQENEKDRILAFIDNLEEEKKYKEEQIKAQKRQNKLIAIALEKAKAQSKELTEDHENIQKDINLTIKQSVKMPSLMISPFQLASIAQGDGSGYQMVNNENEQPNGNQILNLKSNNNDLANELKDSIMPNDQFQASHEWSQMPRKSIEHGEEEDTILKEYTKQLMSSGRTDDEIVGDLEHYYNQLCTNCDQEILRLREELQLAEAEERTTMAEELVIPQSDIDNLSNFFLDCIYAQQKALRQRLVRMKFDHDPEENPKQTKLLETYMKIVKTGAPDEIEQFSKIERQKLVELLCTNQDLLNFMFDKMFFNNVPPNNNRGGLSSDDTETSSGDQNKHISHALPLNEPHYELNQGDFLEEQIRSHKTEKSGLFAAGQNEIAKQ